MIAYNTHMRKLFSVEKDENYTICFLGHRLLEICDHYLISFSLDSFTLFDDNYTDNNLAAEKISEQNVEYLRNIGYNYKTISRYVYGKKEPEEGFIYFTKEEHKPVGCIWVMYRGGNEAQYRVRHVDAFGFYFFVFPKFRGNHYIEYFIFNILKHLKAQGIDKLYASVRKNNDRALKAYRKAGMKIEASKRFYRFIRWRIPYPIV